MKILKPMEILWNSKVLTKNQNINNLIKKKKIIMKHKNNKEIKVYIFKTLFKSTKKMYQNQIKIN